MDLGRRGLGAEQALVVEEERVAWRPRRVRRPNASLSKLYSDGLDLAVVADLVAEAEEGVLDDPPGLRDRVQVPERELVARKRDVDALLRQPPVELGPRELGIAAVDGSLEPLAERVQRHAGLAVAHFAQRKLELAFPPEVLDAHALDVVRRGGTRDGCERVFL